MAPIYNYKVRHSKECFILSFRIESSSLAAATASHLVSPYLLLDQTIYGSECIELVITQECNYRGAM